MRRIFISCAVLVTISGCGTVPLTHGTASSAPPAADVKTSVAKTSAAATGSPRQRAEADAASILASFVPPAGARKLSAAPSLDGGVLGHPPETPASPDFIDDASVWQVPGQFPLAVLSWEASHLSRRFTFSGMSGYELSTHSWTLPPVTGVLDSRWLLVTAVSDGAGGTDLRVEGQVSYTPARPAASYVTAAAVHGVVVTAVPGRNDRAKPPAPLVITGPAKVRSLVALVNGLPLTAPGLYSCPDDTGGGVRLTFLSSVGRDKGANGPAIRSAVLATALALSSGCSEVQLTIDGTQTDLDSGPTVAERALAISGMRWRLPT